MFAAGDLDDQVRSIGVEIVPLDDRAVTRGVSAALVVAEQGRAQKRRGQNAAGAATHEVGRLVRSMRAEPRAWRVILTPAGGHGSVTAQPGGAKPRHPIESRTTVGAGGRWGDPPRAGRLLGDG